MTDHIDDNRKPPASHHHLFVAMPAELPRTLGEFVGRSNVAAALAKKLGGDALWLLADSVFAYTEDGDVAYYDDTRGIPMPVEYEALRDLGDEATELTGYQMSPYDQLAVFSLERDRVREAEQYHDHVIYEYAQVAISLGQEAALLESIELNLRDLAWFERGQRPYLVRSRPQKRPERRRKLR